MRLRKICMLLAVLSLVIVNVGTACANGVWSNPAKWLGDPEDKQGAVLAKKIRAKVINRQMTMPIYDVVVDCHPGSGLVLPITVDTMDISAGFPAHIVWIGRYNGYNEESLMSFSGTQRTNTTRFTCTTSETGNKFYGLEGIVTWTPKTKRAPERICVFWDSTLRASVYLGASFNDIMEILGIPQPVPGFETNDGHDWLEDTDNPGYNPEAKPDIKDISVPIQYSTVQ
ncbi:hypothetical protein [uncultured Cloacibacillus sp.]|uniref:hypothetical protein n=1 Tax=uncultured Cloacibacillus sp. TaxID=889794 RepID=UPI0026DAD86D|nr:hypothetical protein [uncultured Cloacibacillus sp.]